MRWENRESKIMVAKLGRESNGESSPRLGRVCHDSRMQHNLPPTPAFRDALKTDPIQEIALRVVVELS